MHMQKADLDHVLEKAVADALGVRMAPRRQARPPRPRQVAKAPKRTRTIARELHPA